MGLPKERSLVKLRTNLPKESMLARLPRPALLDLGRDWKTASTLKPLDRKQAEEMPLDELAARAKALMGHWKMTLMSEHQFIVSFRVELNVLRRRCRQQGRQVIKEGKPSWGEVKKLFRLSGRQVDRLLEEPGRRKARKALPPVPSFIVTRGDAPSLARGLRGAASDGGGGPDAALLQGFAARLDEEWALALLASLQDRLYDLRYERHRREVLEGGAEPQDAAEHAHLMAQQEEADDEEEEKYRRRDGGKAGEVPKPAEADTLPDTGDEAAAATETEPDPIKQGEVNVHLLADTLNTAFALKPGRHEAVREMLKALDKCVLWEISFASSEERRSRLHSADTSAQHVSPSEAAEEVLRRGGFWSAKALTGEADIHVTSDSAISMCGVSLDHFKQHVLGLLRMTGKLKTRMLGRVNWYCHPDHEAALKAAKNPEGPEFHYAEGELRKGAAPQPPLVEPRAALNGQDADVHVHPAPAPPGDEVASADMAAQGQQERLDTKAEGLVESGPSL